MAKHTAQKLFNLNIRSSQEMNSLHEAMSKIRSSLEIDWLLRASVVFSISAMDAYFHDKVKYRVGKISAKNMPPALARFKVSIEELEKWELARRKGNVIRNWLTDHFSVRPLQKQQDVADALRMVGIDDFWNQIEKNQGQRNKLLDELKEFTGRRNQIAHEGDRKSDRASGKKLRALDIAFANRVMNWVKGLITRVEKAFPD